MKTQRQIVATALEKIVCDAEHNEALIARFFSQNYQQKVDGKQLDYLGFINHMKLLKHITKRINLSIIAIAEQGNHVLTHHRVEVEKPDGNVSAIEVFAHFTLDNGLICRCDELTRLISGDEEDRDMGSRSE